MKKDKRKRKNKYAEEEKDGSYGHSSGSQKMTYIKKQPKIKQAQEEGFTGDTETWFDGNSISLNLIISCRCLVQVIDLS